MTGDFALYTYAAGPSPGERMDMIALGVRWTLKVSSDNAVVSTSWIDGDTIASPTISLGSVHRSGQTVTFYGLHSMLSGRAWTLNDSLLVSENQTVAGINAIIRFKRQ